VCMVNITFGGGTIQWDKHHQKAEAQCIPI